MRVIGRAAAALSLGLALAACDAGDALGPAQRLAPDGGSASYYGIGHYAGAVPRPCLAAAYDQFDFWVGSWDIYNPADAHVATSVVTSELDGCVVMEDYIANGGFAGMSLNMYDAATGTWHQFFVDNFINNYRLSGERDGASMVMTGTQYAIQFRPGGAYVVLRDDSVVWTPEADGRVRQTFYPSIDGAPRFTGFNGLYVPNDDLQRGTPGGADLCQRLPGFDADDFLPGTWTVAAEDGPALGTAHVRTALNQCLTIEDFDAGSGYRSRSYLFYDFLTATWYRSVADTRGRYVELSGPATGGRLVLQGVDQAPDGSEILVRNTLESEAGGVRQSWATSRDGGETWVPEITLLYAGT